MILLRKSSVHKINIGNQLDMINSARPRPLSSPLRKTPLHVVNWEFCLLGVVGPSAWSVIMAEGPVIPLQKKTSMKREVA